MATSFLDPLLARSQRDRLQLVNVRLARVLAAHVEVAFDSASRRRGLLGRERMSEGHALVIAPCWAVHTWSMRFVIDVVFVARDGRVVAIRCGVVPRRVAVAWRGFAAIELAAGSAASAGLLVGDVLTVRAGVR